MNLWSWFINTCRRKESKARCRPWWRWPGCLQVQGCKGAGMGSPPRRVLWHISFSHICAWISIECEPVWGSRRWERGLWTDKEPCSPWRSDLPGNPSLWETRFVPLLENPYFGILITWWQLQDRWHSIWPEYIHKSTWCDDYKWCFIYDISLWI